MVPAKLQNIPSLEELNSVQLEAIFKAAVYQKYVKQMEKAIDVSGINYNEERDLYLYKALKNEHTRQVYAAGIKRLEEYAESLGTPVLNFTMAQADNFVYAIQEDVTQKGKSKTVSASTVRSRLAGPSAFFSWLERRHEGVVRSPFKGTRTRPAKKPAKETVVPTVETVAKILSVLPPVEKAMVTVMAYRGLRAGALPGLVINGHDFKTFSKGKEYRGELPDIVLNTIADAGLDTERPFSKAYRAGKLTFVSAPRAVHEVVPMEPVIIENRINSALKTLYKQGVIPAAYSCHDFRHFYAVQEYGRDKDIERVKTLLNHESIEVTDIYMKSLRMVASTESPFQNVSNTEAKSSTTEPELVSKVDYSLDTMPAVVPPEPVETLQKEGPGLNIVIEEPRFTTKQVAERLGKSLRWTQYKIIELGLRTAGKSKKLPLTESEIQKIAESIPQI